MNSSRFLAVFAVCASIGALAGQAQAQHVVHRTTVGVAAPAGAEAEGEERLDVSFPERGIVIGHNILAGTLALELLGVPAEAAGGAAAAKDTATGFGIPVSARFGITRDLEVHAVVLPIVLAPHAHFGGQEFEGLEGPSVGALFRFLHGPLEVGAGLDVTIVTADKVGVGITPGAQGRFHIGKIAAIDAAVRIPIVAGAVSAGATGVTTTTIAGLQLPVAFSIDITRPLHVAANSGIVVGDFGEAGGTFAIPLGVSAGYAIAGKHGPIVDIDPFFRWPQLIHPGTERVGFFQTDKVNASVFATGIELTGYLYL